MFDVAIIGTGPAGISAALTLKQLNKKIIWFGNKDLSFKINSAEKIRNYPGLINISGNDMKEVFLKQIKEMDLEIESKQVTGIYDMGNSYNILCGNDFFEAKSIILAVGVEAVKPIKGEIENLGNGVSYCATCDGFLYKNKEISVVITSKEYEHEVEYLASLASNVKVIPLYKDVNLMMENIEIINKMPIEIQRNNKKIQLVFKDFVIESDGIFMLKSAVSPAVLVPGLTEENGHILVDRSCKTNLKGVFAAGDCTGRPYQYAKAVGEGNIAAHSVVSYLNELK